MVRELDPALWEAYFSENPDPCLVYEVGDSPRFTLVAANPAWFEVTGLPQDVLGKSIEALMPPEVMSVIAPRLERSVSARAHLSYEEELRFKNQARYWRTSIAPVIVGGEVRYLALFGHDLTDMRNNHELERRLQETQKLESLGVMAGGIAHDFNNLLTGILGHVGLIRANDSSSEALKEHAGQIEIAAQRAADLCKQMLTYAGRGRTSVRRLGLDDLVRETTQLLHLTLAKNTRLELRLGGNGAAVQGDATQLQQVIMNLVLNASEACEGKPGLVTITTGVESSKGKPRGVKLALDMMDSQFAFLEVTDDGVGMSAQTKARMFDPFFTTKFTGRGLGLSAVHGIVRGHGGGIGIESEPGRGTTMRVLLPIVSGEPEPAPSPASVRPLTGSGLVLVVDDEEVVRGVVQSMLESLGFGVVAARDGHEGVDLLRSGKQPFVAALLDLAMPRLDGVAVLEQLRGLGVGVPVILMSGYDEQDATERFSGSGLAGFLQKPFTAEMLGQRLAVALRHKS